MPRKKTLPVNGTIIPAVAGELPRLGSCVLYRTARQQAVAIVTAVDSIFGALDLYVLPPAGGAHAVQAVERAEFPDQIHRWSPL